MLPGLTVPPFSWSRARRRLSRPEAGSTTFHWSSDDSDLTGSRWPEGCIGSRPCRGEGQGADPVHPRCAEPRHIVPVQPRRQARAAAGASSTRAPLPNADPVVLPPGEAGRPLHQLAAGPSEQLRRSSHVSREGPGAAPRGRPRGRDLGLRPLRFLPRAPRELLSLRVCGLAASRAAAVPLPRGTGGLLRPLSPDDRAGAADSGFPRGSQPETPPGRALRDPPRAGRAVEGRDAQERKRIVPRFGVAPRAAAEAHWTGGALRVGLSHPAETRRAGARRPLGAREGFHGPSRVVRGLPPGRRLDRPR